MNTRYEVRMMHDWKETEKIQDRIMGRPWVIDEDTIEARCPWCKNRVKLGEEHHSTYDGRVTRIQYGFNYCPFCKWRIEVRKKDDPDAFKRKF